MLRLLAVIWMRLSYLSERFRAIAVLIFSPPQTHLERYRTLRILVWVKSTNHKSVSSSTSLLCNTWLKVSGADLGIPHDFKLLSLQLYCDPTSSLHCALDLVSLKLLPCLSLSLLSKLQCYWFRLPVFIRLSLSQQDRQMLVMQIFDRYSYLIISH